MNKRRRQLSSKSVGVLQRIAEGHTYEKILAISSELTYLDIFDAAREAVDMATEGRIDYERQLAETRKAHPRAYEKWTHEEEHKLTQLLRSGVHVNEIAVQLQRKPGAIVSRMLKLNLVQGSSVPK